MGSTNEDPGIRSICRQHPHIQYYLRPSLWHQCPCPRRKYLDCSLWSPFCLFSFAHLDGFCVCSSWSFEYLCHLIYHWGFCWCSRFQPPWYFEDRVPLSKHNEDGAAIETWRQGGREADMLKYRKDALFIPALKTLYPRQSCTIPPHRLSLALVVTY